MALTIRTKISKNIFNNLNLIHKSSDQIIHNIISINNIMISFMILYYELLYYVVV